MPDCPHCGAADSIMTDVFEDKEIYICSFCLFDVTEDLELMAAEEAWNEFDEDEYEASLSGASGNPGWDSLSSNSPA